MLRLLIFILLPSLAISSPFKHQLLRSREIQENLLAYFDQPQAVFAHQVTTKTDFLQSWRAVLFPPQLIFRKDLNHRAYLLSARAIQKEFTLKLKESCQKKKTKYVRVFFIVDDQGRLWVTKDEAFESGALLTQNKELQAFFQRHYGKRAKPLGRVLVEPEDFRPSVKTLRCKRNLNSPLLTFFKKG